MEIDQSEDQRIAILDALGLSLSAKRSEAMAARAACGIEQCWIEDEEFYQGFDDANRSEFANAPEKLTATGQLNEAPKIKGSTVFPNITQPYVDAASARVGDMLLPTTDRNFALQATEIPDILPKDEPPEPPKPQEPQGQPPAPPKPEQIVVMPDGTELALSVARERFKRHLAEAARKAEKAQLQIDDWLQECQYNGENRKVIDDASKLGSGVIKGPVPAYSRASMVRRIGGKLAIVIDEQIKPVSTRIDVWNLFPDFPACGENIHNGSFIFEYDEISSKKLKELKGLPGYLDAQIDQCIEEGPSATAQNRRFNTVTGKELFGIWYYHGEVTAKELTAAGCECEEGVDAYPAMLTMVNDRVIRASINPLDSGDFPYDLIPWKRRQGLPWGMGVARQMRTAQRIVTAATRNLMDNAGLGSGPQFVVRRGVVPENGKWEIVPRKLWVETDESDGQAGAPFLSVVIPMLQVELTNIIQLGMKMAEDVTGLPMLLQGQQGAAPDTVGGMTILNNNASAVLRRIARLFDSYITVPHIQRYYRWLMNHGEDDDCKGDFQIVALGSTALIERDIQNNEMTNVLQMTLNPAFGKNPERAMDEYLKSRRFDPKTFDYTDDEKEKLAQQPKQPPIPIAVAQIRAETEMKKLEVAAKEDQQKTSATLGFEKEKLDAELATEQFKIKSDTDRDTAYVNAEMQRNNAEAAARLEELRVKREIELLKYATAQRISLDKAKVQLATNASKVNLQRELAATASQMGKQVMKPPVEPKGRAPAGQAFQK